MIMMVLVSKAVSHPPDRSWEDVKHQPSGANGQQNKQAQFEIISGRCIWFHTDYFRRPLDPIIRDCAASSSGKRDKRRCRDNKPSRRLAPTNLNKKCQVACIH